MGNQVSLFGAIKVNGRLVVNTDYFFRDVTPADILKVELTAIPDANGNNQTCFKITYNNRQGLTQDTYYLVIHNGLTTLQNFKDGLAALNAANTFTLYTNLVRTSDWAASMVPAGYDVLINDEHHYRDYLVRTNQTVVVLNSVNRESKEQLFFAGDQTLAGTYYYFYSWGD